MTVAILGHGNVGGALARAFSAKGVRVVVAIDPNRTDEIPAWIPVSKCNVAAPIEACSQTDILVLAIPFGAVEEAITPLSKALMGKTVIDCTNPVGPDLTHGLKSLCSGSEHLQSLLPQSHVVKCFSVYGFENLEEPPQSTPRPAMFLCGDSQVAKSVVSELASLVGWEPVDVGPLRQALHLEHMSCSGSPW